MHNGVCMRILLTGDSITDMGRNREQDFSAFSYGNTYPFLLQAKLGTEFPKKHEIINRGISGNRVVDLYARIKVDCWNLKPDLISILIGINDIWHEIGSQNGVELKRFEKVYRMLIEDTLTALSNVKFILIEPFVLHGVATDANFEEFNKIRETAKVVRKIAKDYGCLSLSLQDKFDELAKKYGDDYILYDGVHPSVVGANVIAEEWYKLFKKNFEK